MIFFLILLTSLSNAAATLSLRYGNGALRSLDTFSNFPKHIDLGAVIGLVFYVLSFVTYREVLNRLPASVSYPLTTGLVLLLIAATAVIFFGENLTVPGIIGFFFVLLGVVLISSQVAS